MKIYTRSGDGGETDLFGGGRVRKDDSLIALLGDLDELNASIGCVRGVGGLAELEGVLLRIQRTLFDVGAEVAVSSGANEASLSRLTPLSASEIVFLESCIDGYESILPPLEYFILPGGSSSAAALHLARTVCRRAERTLVRWDGYASGNSAFLPYLNRLSDLIFVLARVQNQRAGVADVPWKPRE